MTTFTIFGHTGFIGSHLKKKLSNQNLILPKRGQIKIKKFLGNIIYCIGSDNWMNEHYDSYMANIGLIPEIINKNNFKSFTFLSTTRIYKKSINTSENSSFQINPNFKDDYYNIKKICAESFLLSQKKKIKIIRLSNIYGENFSSPLVLPNFINSAILKGKINITINKNSKKDFLSINDALDLIYKICTKGRGEIYNLASGKMISLIQIAKKIQRITGCKITLKNQKIIIKEPNINISKLKKEFKFKAKGNLINDIEPLIKRFKLYHANKL